MSKKTNKKLQKHHLDTTSGGANILPKGWELRPKSANDPDVISAGAKAGAIAGAKTFANTFSTSKAKDAAQAAALKAGKQEAVKDTIWHTMGLV